jgi:hypothetical protein
MMNAMNNQPNASFWSNEGIARFHARQAEQKTQEAQQAEAAAAAQSQEFVNVVGSTMVDIVQRYADNNVRANSAQVEKDFRQVYPTAGPTDFRETIDALKRENILYEVSGPPGFMGQRETHLYAL